MWTDQHRTLASRRRPCGRRYHEAEHRARDAERSEGCDDLIGRMIGSAADETEGALGRLDHELRGRVVGIIDEAVEPDARGRATKRNVASKNCSFTKLSGAVSITSSWNTASSCLSCVFPPAIPPITVFSTVAA